MDFTVLVAVSITKKALTLGGKLAWGSLLNANSLVPFGLITSRVALGTRIFGCVAPLEVSTDWTNPKLLSAAQAVLPSELMATSTGWTVSTGWKIADSFVLSITVILLWFASRTAVKPPAVTILLPPGADMTAAEKASFCASMMVTEPAATLVSKTLFFSPVTGF